MWEAIVIYERQKKNDFPETWRNRQTIPAGCIPTGDDSLGKRITMARRENSL
jgi:hypothetical protein